MRKKKYDVFISYSVEHKDFVFPFVKMLKAAKLKVFLDYLEIEGGEDWEQRLYEALETAKQAYFFWCCHAATSEWVEREIIFGAARKGELLLIPCIMCNAHLHPSLKRSNGIDFREVLTHQCDCRPTKPSLGSPPGPSSRKAASPVFAAPRMLPIRKQSIPWPVLFAFIVAIALAVAYYDYLWLINFIAAIIALAIFSFIGKWIYKLSSLIILRVLAKMKQTEIRRLQRRIDDILINLSPRDSQVANELWRKAKRLIES